MTVRNLMAKILEFYREIVIEVYDEETLRIIDRYYIPAHSIDYSNIPKNIWEKEVDMIVLYLDRLSIGVKNN